MEKVYISGAITGTEDYWERFGAAEKKLREQEYIPVNPAKVNDGLPEETSYEEYMEMSLFMLDRCDSIYLLDGWEKSCGANREYGYALAAGKIIRKEDD